VGETLVQLVVVLGALLRELLSLLMNNALVLVWLAWWLGGANWKKVWPALGSGGWAVVVLLWVVSALVWSRLDPKACDCLTFVTVPNFLWQLGAVGLLIASALFCGWLQGVFHWTPPEMELEPTPVHDHAHEVGHGQGPLSVMGPDPGHEPAHDAHDHPHGHSHEHH
jgi:hypothetical protein